MQQIKHTYKDYDIYIVWHDNVISKMDGYSPWVEITIFPYPSLDSCYYEKFETDRVRWDAIDTEYLMAYAENVVDRDLADVVWKKYKLEKW